MAAPVRVALEVLAATWGRRDQEFLTRTARCGSSLVLLVVLGFLCASGAGASPRTADPLSLDELENLVDSDPVKVLRLLDAMESDAGNESAADEIERLCIRGKVLVVLHRRGEVSVVVRQLQSHPDDPNAVAAAHIVHASELLADGGYALALAELKQVPAPASGLDPKMHYRRLMLRGAAESPLGQFAAAVASFQEAQVIADGMPSPARELAAELGAAHVYVKFGELETAERVLGEARQKAVAMSDDWSLMLISRDESDIYDRRDERANERRASLEMLAHAKRVGTDSAMAQAYINLGDSYLKTKEYAVSLASSEEALRLLGDAGPGGNRSIVLFNIGLAHLGLREFRPGQDAADQAIAEVRSAGNRETAIGMLQEYSDALEAGGDVRAALSVLRRQQELQHELLTVDRQRVMLELTQRFDSERQERSIELLRSDNALKSSELKAQKLREWTILSITILVVVAGALLMVAYGRVRRLNRALEESSVRDALTGLHNRRHFQKFAAAQAQSPQFSGGIFLLDIDHFKSVNDEFGHAAGDAVLNAVGQRLRHVVRAEDLLVRWGGEEFLVVALDHRATPCAMLAERLMSAVSADPILYDGRPITCTVSVGYAAFPVQGCVPGISMERALALVDQALYVAKRNGRARTCGIEELNAASLAEIRAIEKGFGDALHRGLLRLIERVDPGLSAARSYPA